MLQTYAIGSNKSVMLPIHSREILPDIKQCTGEKQNAVGQFRL